MTAGTRRFTRPRGRFFGVKDERRRINAGLEAYQTVYGDTVDWYFLRHEETQHKLDDIYDEGSVTDGKVYDGPEPLPVMSVAAQQGQETQGVDDQGFAVYDRVTLRMSYEQARRAGLSADLVRDREANLHDRFVWRDRVFDVELIQSHGHFEPNALDTMVLVVGVQLRPDELLDAPAFARWSG